jgi:alkanesulfonate monooxygenase SsuD/methylene tetrahydromethanopterin reductase-like flavin-dependent oxidoreductase (luciferase family)
LTLGLGAGYLKSEYFALGADFERRNEVMDEYIRAMKTAWQGEEFSFRGTGYEARGARILPAPLQRPHPPLLIGGNSHRAIRRAVELGDAWCPFFTSGAVSATSRTSPMVTESDLAEGIRYLREHCEKFGREIPPKIVLSSITSSGEKMSGAALIDKISRLRNIGVSGVAVNFEGRTRTEWCEHAERFAADVLAKLPKD